MSLLNKSATIAYDPERFMSIFVEMQRKIDTLEERVAHLERTMADCRCCSGACDGKGQVGPKVGGDAENANRARSSSQAQLHINLAALQPASSRARSMSAARERSTGRFGVGGVGYYPSHTPRSRPESPARSALNDNKLGDDATSRGLLSFDEDVSEMAAATQGPITSPSYLCISPQNVTTPSRLHPNPTAAASSSAPLPTEESRKSRSRNGNFGVGGGGHYPTHSPRSRPMSPLGQHSGNNFTNTTTNSGWEGTNGSSLVELHTTPSLYSHYNALATSPPARTNTIVGASTGHISTSSTMQAGAVSPSSRIPGTRPSAPDATAAGSGSAMQYRSLMQSSSSNTYAGGAGSNTASAVITYRNSSTIQQQRHQSTNSASNNEKNTQSTTAKHSEQGSSKVTAYVSPTDSGGGEELKNTVKNSRVNESGTLSDKAANGEQRRQQAMSERARRGPANTTLEDTTQMFGSRSSNAGINNKRVDDRPLSPNSRNVSFRGVDGSKSNNLSSQYNKASDSTTSSMTTTHNEARSKHASTTVASSTQSGTADSRIVQSAATSTDNTRGDRFTRDRRTASSLNNNAESDAHHQTFQKVNSDRSEQRTNSTSQHANNDGFSRQDTSSSSGRQNAQRADNYRSMRNGERQQHEFVVDNLSQRNARGIAQSDLNRNRSSSSYKASRGRSSSTDFNSPHYKANYRPQRIEQTSPGRVPGPGTGRPATDFRDPYEDADQFYGNPTSRRRCESEPRITSTATYLDEPSNASVGRVRPPNEPAKDAFTSCNGYAPVHVQPSYTPAPYADALPEVDGTTHRTGSAETSLQRSSSGYVRDRSKRNASIR